MLLPARTTGLPKDSVANVSQIITLDRGLLTEEVGKLSKRQLDLILTGIDNGPSLDTRHSSPFHLITLSARTSTFGGIFIAIC